MEKELNELKSALKSLVVSSPTQMDVRSLVRDYRNIMGGPIPLAKFGYRDPVLFLKERCKDCFVLQEPAVNPVVTLIVPDTLKHIDQFVKKQKLSSSVKLKGKRISIPGHKDVESHMIANTFNIRQSTAKVIEAKSHQKSVVNTETANTEVVDVVNSIADLSLEEENDEEDEEQHNRISNNDNRGSYDAVQNFLKRRIPMFDSSYTSASVENVNEGKSSSKSSTYSGTQTTSSSLKSARLQQLSIEIHDIVAEHPDGVWCTDIIRLYRERYGREINFTRFGYTSILSLLCVMDEVVSVWQPLDSEDWLVCLVDTESPRDLSAGLRGPQAGPRGPQAGPRGPQAGPRGPQAGPRGPQAGPRGPQAGPRAPSALSHALPTGPFRMPLATNLKNLRQAGSTRLYVQPSNNDLTVDPDDALPGIDFDADVFPEDCMHMMESVPAASLEGLGTGAMLEVIIGEVYSPSHFWLIRLGENYNIAMENVMDEMNEYYGCGEGVSRRLAGGAARAGHYCASQYCGDWHRSLIVRVLDSDTVKVRHIDYGTVETVNVSSLRPLRREWGALPAQAVRARLGGVRPAAGGRRWARAAAAAFLRLVRDARLVGNVVARDRQEDILEVLLINTSTEEDVCLSDALIRAGHADARTDSALRTEECYLFPRFAALESGATPNFAEIHGYLRDGIELDCVDDYRRHVPATLPPADPAPPPSPPPQLPEPPPSPPKPKVEVAKEPSVPTSSNSPRLTQPVPRLPSPRPPVYMTSPPLPPQPPMYMYPPMIRGPYGGCPPPRVYPPLGAYPPPGLYPRLDTCPAPGAYRPPVGGPPIGPGRWGGRAEVSLSAPECAVFQLLARVDGAAARWYAADALSRALGGPPPAPVALNPLAPEFRSRTRLPPALRPPPGFPYPT